MTRFAKFYSLPCGLALAFALYVSTPMRAAAESIVADLTSHHVAVKFDFSGADLTLFGAVVGPEDAKPGDVVVIVEGPKVAVQVRRKERTAGIWINRQSKAFVDVPSFYAVVSNRPVNDFTSEGLRRLLRLDLHALPTASLSREARQEGEAGQTGEFTNAFVRLKKRREHYVSVPDGVQFIGSHLFRMGVRLPADVLSGVYTAKVSLIRDDKLIGQYSTQFDIRKEGLEGLVSNMAHDRPLLYGLLSVILAVAAGLGAAYIFRSPSVKA